MRVRAQQNLAALGLLLLAAAGPAFAVETKDTAGPFTDPEDGAFDLSEWLLERKGFLPVPILISEPAIGYGGGVAALFFRGKLGDGLAAKRLSPPDIYGLVLGGT